MVAAGDADGTVAGGAWVWDDRASLPCVVVLQSGSCLPRGPHNGSTLAAIAAITRRAPRCSACAL